MGATAGRVAQPRAHTVTFYDRDAELVAQVAELLADGFACGDAALVVATPAHAAAIEVALAGHGVDVAVACAAGSYVRLDAATTLASCQVDGSVDADRFAAAIGGAVRVVAQGGAHVRAFGEMVALLWADGDVAGAIAIEALWNDLLTRHDASLCCAYPASSLAGDADLARLGEVCGHHTAVVPPASYADGPPPAMPGEAEEVSGVFVPAAPAARAVRRFVGDACRAWDLEEVSDDAAIVVSELATNAVLHATSPFRVTLRHLGATLAIAVHDTSGRVPTERAADAEALGGRGVPLVDALSTRWGVERRPVGKVVWAHLAAERGGRPATS